MTMKINIKPLLEACGITRYSLAKKIGVTYPTIDNIYSGKSTSIKFSTLENLCKELSCTPNDIFLSDDEKVSNLITNYKRFQKRPKIYYPDSYGKIEIKKLKSGNYTCVVKKSSTDSNQKYNYNTSNTINARLKESY